MKYFQKIMRQDKERFTVPRSVQQTIPIQRIWQCTCKMKVDTHKKYGYLLFSW